MQRLLRSLVLFLTVGLCATTATLAQQLSVEDFALAVKNDRVDEVKSALARGMDPNTVAADGHPVLVTAAREGNGRVVDVLLAAGARVDARNGFGDTALMMAALNGHLDIAKRLRARGASLEGSGWTPLIYAATGGHEAMVTWLLAEGARIDAVSPNGTTALMMAVREQKRGTAELLLAKGANVSLANQDGATALAWAQRADDTEMVARLKKAGAR